ncbi:MAG: hypothetical protein JW954_05655 [Dehalococcoidaceae bacterium]|nr:hypothetical protein [Dehalococcoidaceae bacterium]
MPRGDGMGPPRNASQRGGRMRGANPGAGPGGDCVCPGCGARAPHAVGVPCNSISCPKCGGAMTRQ